MGHIFSQVGILDKEETEEKLTEEEFSSQFGSGHCIFCDCDVTNIDRVKGKKILIFSSCFRDS